MLYNKISSYLSIVLLVLFGLLITTTTYAAPPTPSNQIKIVNFNILAPCWASPDYYPASAGPYLDRVYRRAKIINFLNSRPTADVIALQEVTTQEFGFIKNALKKNYVAYQSLHSPSYWSNWITENPPWEPNGNALLIKKSRFSSVVFQDVALSDSGNHASYITAVDNNTNRKVRLVSIHLDSDYPYNREREFSALLALMPERSDTTDIIAGDFNTELGNTNLQQNIVKAHFKNVLSALGIFDVTSPYSSTYYGHAVFGVIDNILVRNGQPLDGMVVNNGLFQLYPNTKDEDARVTANMQITGSDHFAVEATVKAAP